MVCTLTIGNTVLELAGYTGRSSETQGLDISTDVTSQQIGYVGVFEGRQFFRPGSFVSATFNSMLTFSSLSEAEFYLTSLPTDLVNQTNAVARFHERTAAGTKQSATINCSGSATANGNVNVTFASAIVAGSPITIAVPILNGDGPSTWVDKVIAALKSNLAISKRFLITNAGANILVTARIAAANDSTLAIAIANGSPNPGITQTNSSSVLSGVAPTQTERLAIYDAIAQVSTSHRGSTVSLAATITGRTTAP